MRKIFLFSVICAAGTFYAVCSHAQANTSLSNLTAPTKVNQSLLPSKDSLKNLGSASKAWKDIYLHGSIYYSNIPAISFKTSNTATGLNALKSNTNGDYNTANGYQALYSNTSGSLNTASGTYALFSNTTGYYNTAVGTNALYSNITGYNNTAVGLDALNFNTGYSNTATGTYALWLNTTGYSNTATGTYALDYNTWGSYNTANGYSALYSNTTGHYNTANGGNALYYNTTGDWNTAYGIQTLYANTTGFDNTALGAFAGVSTGSLTNATAIGAVATVDADDKVRVGNVDVTSIGGQVNWTTFSDGRYKKNIKEDVKGLVFINGLRPITYTADINGLNEYFDKGRKHDSAYEKMKADMQPSADEAAKIVYNGFVAQEVEAAAKKLNYDFSGVDKPKTKDGLYGLRYADFVVPLVKAVQELSKEVDDLNSQLNELRKNQNSNLSQSITDGTVKISADQAAISLLGQNIPNPFDRSTIIPFRIPKGCKDATIVIAQTGTGKIVRAIPVSCGETQLSLEAGALSAGTYTYTLYVDGKLIGTKQMERLK